MGRNRGRKQSSNAKNRKPVALRGRRGAARPQEGHPPPAGQEKHGQGGEAQDPSGRGADGPVTEGGRLRHRQIASHPDAGRVPHPGGLPAPLRLAKPEEPTVRSLFGLFGHCSVRPALSGSHGYWVYSVIRLVRVKRKGF